MKYTFFILRKAIAENPVEFIFAAVVFILAAAARIWYPLHIKTEQLYDFATYHKLAQNIYDGLGHSLNGASNAWTGPGYPYALAFFFKLCGNTTVASAKLFNILLSSAVLILSYLIVAKTVVSKRLRFVSYLLLSFMPVFISYVNVVGTETFFVFLLTFLLFVRVYFKQGYAVSAIIGVLTGALALTKPFMLVYPVICGCMLWTETKDIKKTLVQTAVVALCAIALISPWTLRNYRAFGRFIPISYNMGYNMYVNNNSSNTNGAWMDIARIEKSAEAEETINRYLKNGERSIKEAYDIEPFLKSEAVKWIKAHPVQYAKLGLLRVRQTYFCGANDVEQWARNAMTYENAGNGLTRAQFQQNQNLIRLVYDLTFTLFNCFGILFLFATFWSYAKTFFTKANMITQLTGTVFINIAFFTVIFFAFEGQARYAFPVMFFMIMSAISFCDSRGRKSIRVALKP